MRIHLRIAAPYQQAQHRSCAKVEQTVELVQKNPRKLHYKAFGGRRTSETKGGCSIHLRVVSDAAYKKETDDGHSLRGALYCRGAGREPSDFGGYETVVHVIDWAVKSQRHVTRSTFSAELLGAGDAVDQGILISHMLHEVEHGVLSIQEARDRRMHGGYLPTMLYLDAKSVYAAVTATFIKQPAEKSLLSHVQYIR